MKIESEAGWSDRDHVKIYAVSETGEPGSDQMRWPEKIGEGIEAIEEADYPTEDQKRDILYDNAARFLRLEGESHDGM